MTSLHVKLMQAGVQCALREGYLRFSPHLNVFDEDLERFKKILSEI